MATDTPKKPLKERIRERNAAIKIERKKTLKLPTLGETVELRPLSEAEFQESQGKDDATFKRLLCRYGVFDPQTGERALDEDELYESLPPADVLVITRDLVKLTGMDKESVDKLKG